MDAGYAKWIPMGLIGLGLLATPALANHKCHEHKEKEEKTVSSSYRAPRGTYYSYTYRPYYGTYGYVEGEDYTTPENAWWRDYEAMNAERRPSERRGEREYYGSRTVTLRGTIVDLRVFRSDEWTQPHLVAFVQSEGGRVERVVLGSMDRVGDLDINVGDRITVTGTPRAIEGIQAVVARRFETPDAYWGYVAPSAERWFHGEIRSDSQEDIDGVKHTLARVKLDNGDHIQVDLGPTDALPKIDLDRGDDIAFFGPTGTLEGKTTVFADRFNWNNRSFVLNRGGRGPLRLDTEVHAYR